MRVRRSLLVGVGAVVAAIALSGCFGDGVHPVNTGQPGSVGPGLYRVGGQLGGSCTIDVERPYVLGGTTRQRYTSTGGPLYLEVRPTDIVVETTRCGPWLLAALVRPMATPGADFVMGDYRVGPEIAPGTYWHSNAEDNCTWQVVKAFTHDTQDMVRNGGVNDPVTIFSTDFGFTSDHCGIWHKTG